MGGCFAENRHVAFFSKLPGKKAYGVLLKWPLERTCDVGKAINITQQRTHGACGIGSPCHSSLVFMDEALALFALHCSLIITCHNFVERNALKNL